MSLVNWEELGIREMLILLNFYVFHGETSPQRCSHADLAGH